jgi:hypothetical protein
LSLDDFIARCEPYFGWGGCIIDQAFQPRLPGGMTRYYMSASPSAVALRFAVSALASSDVVRFTSDCVAKVEIERP